MSDTNAFPPMGLDAYRLLFGFTSLGDNCEFGLLQRRMGVEQLGLLRFAFCKIEPLIESVRDGFADLDPLEALTVEQPWTDEYVTGFGTRGFQQHTFLTPDRIDRERLRRQEMVRIPFLRRRLMEDLAGGETIFVRKSNAHAPEQMRALHAAMRAHGPNLLLWVEQADTDHPAGSVERVADGLVRGWMDRFAPYGDAPAISVDPWLTVCARAWRLFRDVPPPWAPVAAPLRLGAEASLRGCNGVRCVAGQDGVFDHAADSAGNVVTAVLALGATPPGAVCTVSVRIRLPAAFRGRAVTLVPLRGAWLTVQPAIQLERDRWQRVWASVPIHEGERPEFGLWADLEEGDRFQTSSWTVELADHPGSYPIDVDGLGVH